jgi:hypothetical protein
MAVMFYGGGKNSQVIQNHLNESAVKMAYEDYKDEV